MATPTITIVRGDDHTVTLNVKDNTGAVKDITGARIRMTVDSRPDQIAKDSDNGITEVEFTDAVNGEAKIYLVPADTAGTTQKEIGVYQFDIEMQLSGKTNTLVKGFFKLEEDITT